MMMLLFLPVLQIISVSFNSDCSNIDSSNLQASESSIKSLLKVDTLGNLLITNVSPSDMDSVLVVAENNSLPFQTSYDFLIKKINIEGVNFWRTFWRKIQGSILANGIFAVILKCSKSVKTSNNDEICFYLFMILNRPCAFCCIYRQFPSQRYSSISSSKVHRASRVSKVESDSDDSCSCSFPLTLKIYMQSPYSALRPVQFK